MDMSDYSSSHDALQESEEKFRLLLNSTGQAIYGIDTNGACTFCNPACLRLLRYEHQDQVFGKNMHDLIHYAYRDGTPYPVEKCRIFQAFYEGRGTHFQDEVLWRADGSSFPAEIWSFPQLRQGKVIGAVVTFADISDRKQAEEALQKSESKYRLLFENMTAGFALHEMIYDEQGSPVDYRFIEVNPAFEKLTGTPAAAVIGKRVKEIMPETEQYWIEVYGNVARTGVPASYQNYSKELDRYYDTWTFSPRKDQFAVIFTDITDRKRAEDSVKLDEDRLATLLKLTQMKFETEKELTDFALEEAVRLTRSRGGYLHFFNSDEQTIQLHSWSRDVLSTCTAEENHAYPLDKAGVWADSIRGRGAVIHNDYQGLVGKKGYPVGHFYLVRHLGIPIFDGERIVGVTGVGNKAEPYDESDVRQITLFMSSMWGILKQRRMDRDREKLIKELKYAIAEIKTLSGLLPICSSCKKIRDDKGYWNQIESYISSHSEAEFTHGICPDCAEKMYQDIKKMAHRNEVDKEKK
jgi:PAS domain S-box-containing protein